MSDAPAPKPCSHCHGRGYYENVALYFGRAECPVCEGTGEEPVFDECVRCGYCCTVGPCAHGIWNEQKHQCDLLRELEDGTTVCALYDAIKAADRECLSPAFGGGCSSTLFNERRERILLTRK